MIIYLDESYDWQGTYFLLGALFVREDHDVFLASFNDIKKGKNSRNRMAHCVN
jgi:hypothetical protein